MYKLLIVDDEEIEREGMAQFIPWEKYQVELAGTAWNGLEGYEKVKSLKPDIVLTDIKMPVMNGIEFIKKVRKELPDIEFIVLSGYGEYEFTSQAMEEGIRHYILKPCDEEKIAEVIDKVKHKISERRSRKEQELEVTQKVHQLMPRAREQVFQNLLLDREQLEGNYEQFLEEYGQTDKSIRLLAMRAEESFDQLEQFVLGNILGELLGLDKVLLSTVIQHDVLFLVEEEDRERIEKAVVRTKQEYQRLEKSAIVAAVSESGSIHSLAGFYKETQELFRMSTSEQKKKLLSYGLFKDVKDETSLFIDYDVIQRTDDYAEILSELSLSFMKMEIKGYSYEEMRETAEWMLRILYGAEVAAVPVEYGGEEQKSRKLYESVSSTITAAKGLNMEGKEEERVRNILLATFQNIRNPDLSIQFLAKEVLFMNEDYFGRIFQKNRKIKFSSFLLEQRVHLSQKLLKFDPELKISRLAEMVGYLPDGQYFSKAFKKVTGITPTEYRDSLKPES